jgi:hypothetical protein
VYWHKSEISNSDLKAQATLKFRRNHFKTSSASLASSGGEISESSMAEYGKSVRASRTYSLGGSWRPGMSIDEWLFTLDESVAIVENEQVELITSLMTYYNFPLLARAHLSRTRALVSDAIGEYMQRNLLLGCLNRRSVNYQPVGFINHHEASACAELYIFGALFENKTTCDYGCQMKHTSSVPNYLTNKARCPDGFFEIVHSFNMLNVEYYNLVECKGDVALARSPVLFGGIYTELEDNPATGTKTCPHGYEDLPTVQNKANICLSKDLQLGLANAIPFAGFLSTCSVSNVGELRCPGAYDKRLVTTINGCFLFYCTKQPRVDDASTVGLHRPPFVEMPARNYYKTKEAISMTSQSKPKESNTNNQF